MATNREQFLEVFGLPKDTSLSLKEIADLSQTPLGALREVFNRGVGAWKGNIASVRVKGTFAKDPNTSKYPRSARLGKEQWGYARVYSFVMGQPTTFTGADADIARRFRLLD